MSISEQFEQYRDKLLAQANKRLSPMLQRRVTAQDIVQQTLQTACSRQEFFEARPDVPLYNKLHIILLQTIAAQERYHLQSSKRDASREVNIVDDTPDSAPGGAHALNWNALADTAAGPMTCVAHRERKALIQKLLKTLSQADQEILELRLIQGMSNAECATYLDISPKNASIRLARAVARLQAALSQFTRISP